MAWSYTARVCPERQMALFAAPDFDSIATHIVEEMRIISFDVCRGNRGEVRGCKRPEFSLQVSNDTFDMFFNGPRGYRAQYHNGIENGEMANVQLLLIMSDKLIDYTKGKSTTHTVNDDHLRLSLKAKSAKIWINEEGARAQRGDDVGLLKVDLEVEPWLTTAQTYVATPAKFTDTNKEIKALDGVKAPTGSVLEVKGAFVDDHGEEHIAEDKKDRSLQIHLYGYT